MKPYLLLIFFVSYSSWSQKLPFKKLREVKIQPDVTRISIDRLGGFYTVSNCSIEQFDPEGILKKTFKNEGCNAIELLEAWPLMRIYAYQNYKQQFTLFDSHLDEVEKLNIDPSFAVEPQLAAPSSDLKYYWILDVDNSIKRVNISANSVDLESDALKEVTGKFSHIREYQNLLFILNETSGIYVINKLGTLISKISEQDITYFSFAGEDIYYLKGNRVVFHDIFTKDKYSVEVQDGVKFVLATDERLILFKNEMAEIFEFSQKR